MASLWSMKDSGGEGGEINWININSLQSDPTNLGKKEKVRKRGGEEEKFPRLREKGKERGMRGRNL